MAKFEHGVHWPNVQMQSGIQSRDQRTVRATSQRSPDLPEPSR